MFHSMNVKKGKVLSKEKGLSVSLWKEIWKTLGSVRFAIIILLLLALASIFAIAIGDLVVPPGLAKGVYIRHLGESKYQLYHLLGFLNPYRSWWFATLLGLLALSLTACSIQRFRAVARVAFDRSLRTDAEEIRRLRISRRFSVRRALSDLEPLLISMLRKRAYRVTTLYHTEHLVVSAHKGSLGRLGHYVVHVGLILVLVGGISTSRFGYRTMGYGGVGDRIEVPGKTFRVRVDHLEVQTTERGEIKDWFSTLTVLDPDSVRTKTIQVNDPLSYKGITFYQAEWQEDPRQISDIALRILDKEGKEIVRRSGLTVGQRIPVPEINGEIQITNFVPDLVIGEGGQVTSRSAQHRNPAIRVWFYSPGEEAQGQWCFLNFPDFHMRPDAPYRMQFLGYRPTYITGLQIARAPGTGVIWVGFVVTTIGIVLAFFVTHRRIWGVVEPQEDATCKVTLGGQAHKGQAAFGRELEDMVQYIRKGGES